MHISEFFIIPITLLNWRTAPFFTEGVICVQISANVRNIAPLFKPHA